MRNSNKEGSNGEPLQWQEIYDKLLNGNGRTENDYIWNKWIQWVDLAVDEEWQEKEPVNLRRDQRKLSCLRNRGRKGIKNWPEPHWPVEQ